MTVDPVTRRELVEYLLAHINEGMNLMAANMIADDGKSLEAAETELAILRGEVDEANDALITAESALETAEARAEAADAAEADAAEAWDWAMRSSMLTNDQYNRRAEAFDRHRARLARPSETTP